MNNYFRIAFFVVMMTLVGTLGAQNSQTKTIKIQGIEMVETLNEDGTDLIRRPYRWFAGMAEADVESLAAEMAQLEAYAAVSRVIENAVLAESERAAIAVDGIVHKALKSQWQQVSTSIQHACEPFGEAESTLDDSTGLYHVIAKVGIRGDRYVKILDGASNFKPADLNDDDLQQFINANEAIIDASKSN